MMALDRVTKWYGLRRRVPVLRDVDLDLEPAEVMAVTGANGSGKSTLLRILAGASQPSRGRVRGRPDRTGYLPDRFPPRLRFTPAEYLRSGLDERTRRELATILIEVRQRGSCVVLSEHTVSAFADRVVRVDGGRLTVHSGSPAEPTVLVELVRPDGTVLRSQVPRHQVDKTLAQALHDGLSVRRVVP